MWLHSILGTFGVPWNVVSEAAFGALMKFDAYFGRQPQSQQYLLHIRFVNIDRHITGHLIDSFTSFLNKSGTQPVSNLRYHQSPSPPDIDSSSSRISSASSVRKGNAPLKALPQGTDTNSTNNSSQLEVTSRAGRCCVCAKELRPNIPTSIKGCKHKCCRSCRTSPCQKCLQSKASSDRKQPEDRTETTKAAAQTGAENVPLVSGRTRRRNSINTDPRKSLKSTPNKSHDSSQTSDDNPNSSQDQSDSFDSEFSTPSPLRRTNSFNLHDRRKSKEGDTVVEDCPICMDKITDPKTLPCKHTFCTECIDQAFKHASKCPCCGQIFGALKGNQPDGGTMKVSRSKEDLSGYRGAGMIIIHYDIPSGFQNVTYCVFVNNLNLFSKYWITFLFIPFIFHLWCFHQIS